jgi:hypothetical protein
VPKKGLEPPHPCGYMDLNHARLPIPPLRQKVFAATCSLPVRKELRVIFYRGTAGCQTSPAGLHRFSVCPRTIEATIAMSHSDKLPVEVTMRLRLLAHDLSNSLETLLQASYLLNQADLKPDARKWVQMIDAASQEATRINREIREILRTQSPE